VDSPYAHPVEFEATCARREGRLLSKAQRDRAWVRGLLVISEQRDSELHRIVRVARLLKTGHISPDDVLSPLRDAQVVEVRPDWWTITGFERVECKGAGPGEKACYQQSWFMVPVKQLRRDDGS
jgi:hypothetical protein